MADGMMSVVVLMDMQTFKDNLRSFLREIGLQLRTSVRVRQDDLKNDMIYPWKLDGGSGGFFTKYPHGSSGVIAYLEIDNRKCVHDGNECFSTANEVCIAPDQFLKLSSFFLRFLPKLLIMRNVTVFVFKSFKHLLTLTFQNFCNVASVLY